jgi:DNA-binding CsgD family transcriptional regulator
MSDELATEWRDNALPEKLMAAARERRARRQLGGLRTPKISPSVRHQQNVREFVAIEKKDLYAFPAPSVRLLQQFFKLTPAEARVAQFMARAETIEDAACALNIRLCTARSHLAAIFEKTATARQAELVALLSRLVHLSQSRAAAPALSTQN